MDSLTLTSPAKINLMLSVHGQRGDGFHALTSVVVALDFGDTLRVSLNAAGADRLRCSDPAVPTGEANLILQAAAAFRAELGQTVYCDFDLEKRIPMGAGLGGGSSNAAVALSAMNRLTGERLSPENLRTLAAGLGSDCPFFIDSVPAIMSGRGELLEVLPPKIADPLRGKKVILFRPDFAINTAWAYRRLVETMPAAYESEALALERLATFRQCGATEELLFNTFEASVGEKYLAIPCLLGDLRAAGFACLMSGSGSCCFALTAGGITTARIREICQDAWGSEIFFVETSILD
jgi:4-diphosphocytidyl-2-C-methyl-D-erythritol kinase